MSRVIVIGGGPAGIMAACTAAKNGNSVTLFESNQKIGRKLMITGKGRCNVTNACYNISELISYVPKNGRFLYSAFSNFGPSDVMDLFTELGVPLKVERGNRVFPVSDRAVDIVDALFFYLKQCKVFVRNEKIIKVEKDDEFSVFVKNGKVFKADSVVIATGGISYPTTGSTGDGYEFARSFGHTITSISPSLVPIESESPYCKAMQGLSLKNVAIKIKKDEITVYDDFGEMLFTHFGVSGPMILSASSHIRKIEPNEYFLHIDLKPALTVEQLDARILRDFENNSNKDFHNVLGGLVPSKMIPVILDITEISPYKKVNQITKSERMNLISVLKDLTIPLLKFRPINEAIITSGGVDVKEINPKTMESKIVPNLYFAGEIIDVDAYTGGFNLQIAFSTGYLAGNNIY